MYTIHNSHSFPPKVGLAGLHMYNKKETILRFPPESKLFLSSHLNITTNIERERESEMGGYRINGPVGLPEYF